MKLLIIGGSIFLGRHIANVAMERGHTITFFNRGQHFPDDFHEIEKIRGDRATDLYLLQDRKWDAVIDTCGYVPRIVGLSAKALCELVDNYVYISSVSVYSESNGHLNESASTIQIENKNIEEITGETYGALKQLSERAAEYYMPNRVLVIRPGLIVGANDWSGRFNYWVQRAKIGGEILIPNTVHQNCQFIDVLDLAEWIIRMVEKKAIGVFNADGKLGITMANVLKTCQNNTIQESHFIQVSEDFLFEQNIQPYTELPLWIPEQFGARTFNCSKALKEGLTYRSINDTIKSASEWLESLEPLSKVLGNSLSLEREKELLQNWYNLQLKV